MLTLTSSCQDYLRAAIIAWLIAYTIHLHNSVCWRWRQAILWCANLTVRWQRRRWNLAIAIASAAYTHNFKETPRLRQSAWMQKKNVLCQPLKSAEHRLVRLPASLPLPRHRLRLSRQRQRLWQQRLKHLRNKQTPRRHKQTNKTLLTKLPHA